MMNAMKTTVLLAALTGLFILIGRYVGGREGMIVAFAIAMLMNFVSYWFSDKIVLSMYHARQVNQYEAPQLYAIVEKLARKARIPMPKVYIVPNDTPNAFATGRSPSHASVAATEGILRLLSAEELEGVMAHELAHVLHRDILTGTIAATIGGAISMLAHTLMYFGGGRDRDRSGGGIGALAVVILAPIAAMLIQMAISRSREYAADATGARICGNPNALANALTRLQSGVKAAPMDGMGDPATSHLFIVNPFRGNFITNLFSTHPPMEERVKRLRAMRQ